MWKFTRMLLILLFSLSLCSCADNEPKEELKIERSGMSKRTATVESVDMVTRMVTLKNPDGTLFEFYANKQVVNLPQVKVGDKVVVVYAEAISVRMAKPGEVRNETSKGAARTAPGKKPGGIELVETIVTAEIENIDKVNEQVTLRLPEGKLRVVKVQDPANLDKVSVGDTIVITNVKEIAISVQKAL